MRAAASVLELRLPGIHDGASAEACGTSSCSINIGRVSQRGVSHAGHGLDVYRLPVQLLAGLQLFAANASIRFKDKYRVAFGIENLLDEEPPMNYGLGNPTLVPTAAAPYQFGAAPAHVTDGAT